MARKKEQPPPEALIEVARFVREDQAEDRALVILAMGLSYWIIPTDGLYSLMVLLEDEASVSAELKKFEEERRAESERQQREFEKRSKESLRRTPPATLYGYGIALAGFFALQAHFSGTSLRWMERGEANSAAILHGEWWRTVTALTLHGDLGHLIANLAVGIIFAAALLPLLGRGWTWLGIVASGAAGNWINAWGYRGLRELHLSIGASTAVFGALGMLVGWQVVAALREEEGTRADHVLVRRVWFPIAAGLALLAYLGTGDPGQRLDVMAHFFGAVSGGCLGVALAWARLPQRTSDWLQTVLAIVALFMPCAAWLIALRHSA